MTLQEDRFWIKVANRGSAGCWNWLASKSPNGYGRMRWDGRLHGAHRISWRLWHGREIPEGLVIDHLCRNRACVNPSHLEAVTQSVNLLRGETTTARNAAATHCPQGHEYTPENTWIDRGSRVCRECKCAQVRAHYWRKKAAL